MVDDDLKELLADFLLECDERLLTIESALLEVTIPTTKNRTDLLESIRRDLHTLKGNSGMMGLPDLQTLAHRLEDKVAELDSENPEISPLLHGVDEFKSLLDDLRSPDEPGPEPEARPVVDTPHKSSVRVSTDNLDLLLDHATEALVIRNRLAELSAQSQALDPESADYGRRCRQLFRDLEEARLDLEKVLAPLDDGLRRLRMVPLKSLFGRLQRIVHDEALRGGKQAKLVTRGEETPLDAALVEVAADTLGHLVRNAVVHGIEDPQTREVIGKPREGTVLLEATVRGRYVEIEVLDDGTGIDQENLRRAAERHGIDPNASLQELVFRPGITTRDEADRSSGRGIGTAAVLAAVHRYGGTIDVDTSPGVGSRFLLRLPLTVAVTEALILEADGERFALPIGNILETTSAKGGEVYTSGGEQFLQRESMDVPATDLAAFLSVSRAERERAYAVVLTAEGRLRALLVDRLGDVTKVVVNPLDPELGQPLGIGGTTVLGSGDVIMILDAQSFVGSSLEAPS